MDQDASPPFTAWVIVARRARSPSSLRLWRIARRLKGLTAQRSRSFGRRAVNAIFGQFEPLSEVVANCSVNSRAAV